MYCVQKHKYISLSLNEIISRTNIISSRQIVNEINHLLQRINLRYDDDIYNACNFQRYERMHAY